MSTQGRASAGLHVHPVPVRWGHCDVAGIVYYPRYYEFFHEAMETWFSQALGVPYQELIVGRKIGFPSVHTEADFRRPSALGDALEVELQVNRLGRTSIGFALAIRGHAEPTPRVTGRKVVVAMGLDPEPKAPRQAMEIPADLRARIEAFGVAG